jgi:general secretion pathway protein J
MRRDAGRGFTLIEVLIALAITALVSAAAYAGISAVLEGVEGTRAAAQRTEAINRAFMLLSRDIRQFAERPVRDEFGDLQPALSGGRLAQFPLTLTRTGWHNNSGAPRSHLQRVSYYLEDGALWRLHYRVLDRTVDSEPLTVRLLDDVDDLELRFLPRLDALEPGRGSAIDTVDWAPNWVREVGVDTPLPAPPAAVEVRLRLADVGLLTRLYVLPSR